jgi:predicted DNA-binding protein YlxM (UPF0122 family)
VQVLKFSKIYSEKKIADVFRISKTCVKNIKKREVNISKIEDKNVTLQKSKKNQQV